METNKELQNESLQNIDSTYQNKYLKLLTLMVVIYPIIPLTLLSLLIILSTIAKYIGRYFEEGFNVYIVASNLGDGILPFIGLFAGAAGFYGLVRIMLNNRNMTSLLLIIYGSISYLLITGFLMMVSLRHASWLTLVHAIYLVMSYAIIGIQIYITYKSVKQDKKIKHESLVDVDNVENAHEV